MFGSVGWLTWWPTLRVPIGAREKTTGLTIQQNRRMAKLKTQSFGFSLLTLATVFLRGIVDNRIVCEQTIWIRQNMMLAWPA